ncbi:MAG: enoyl-CoA hydratase/isomerase family protein, partial [Metallibacterium sp.]
AVDRALHALGKGGPLAQHEAKRLALRLSGMTPDSTDALDREHATLIATLRVSPEGQQGLGAFLDKRSPCWIAPSE